MATYKAREDERKGMERHERKMRKDRRDEKRGMDKYWDHHNRHHRPHHAEDDKHLERQKVHCDRKRGIERVMQKDHHERGQGGSLNQKGHANWSRRGDKLTPRRA